MYCSHGDLENFDLLFLNSQAHGELLLEGILKIIEPTDFKQRTILNVVLGMNSQSCQFFFSPAEVIHGLRIIFNKIFQVEIINPQETINP